MLDGTAMPIAYAKGRIDMTVTSASLSICRSLDELTPVACDALAEYARTVEFRRGERLQLVVAHAGRGLGRERRGRELGDDGMVGQHVGIVGTAGPAVDDDQVGECLQHCALAVVELRHVEAEAPGVADLSRERRLNSAVAHATSVINSLITRP